jgi:hypothetical protein
MARVQLSSLVIKGILLIPQHGFRFLKSNDGSVRATLPKEGRKQEYRLTDAPGEQTTVA